MKYLRDESVEVTQRPQGVSFGHPNIAWPVESAKDTEKQAVKVEEIQYVWYPDLQVKSCFKNKRVIRCVRY